MAQAPAPVSAACFLSPSALRPPRLGTPRCQLRELRAGRGDDLTARVAAAIGCLLAGRRAGSWSLACRRSRRTSVGRQGPRSRFRATADKTDIWDETNEDDDNFLEELELGVQNRSKTKIENFKAGADFSQAKLFAATRTFAVAPWSEDVKPKPILAVSDSTGRVAQSLSLDCFAQFGPREKAKVKVFPEVRTTGTIREAVAKAASVAPRGALAIEKAGGLLVYTMASPKLGTFIVEESQKQGVPCVDALELVLLAMERLFGMKRSLVFTKSDGPSSSEAKGSVVFAASDGSGNSALQMARAALKQFPGVKVDAVTLCPNISSMGEVNYVVQEAIAANGLIIFTFASPGMSRFMRQQCERAKIPYADAFQPLLVAFEKYLDYPPVGIPGGHDLASPPKKPPDWKAQRLEP